MSLHYDSSRDVLTGLYSRARIRSDFVRLNFAHRWPFSVIVTDVLGLKSLNDEYSHQSGDEILCAVALVLKQLFPADSHATLARIGDDEFAVIIPGANEQAAAEAVSRIRTEWAATKVASVTGQPVQLAIGAVTCDRSTNALELWSLIDARVYADKRALRKTSRE